MQLKFGQYILSFGRKRSEPTRVTSDTYNSVMPFISVTRQRQNLPKPNAQLLRTFSQNTVVRMVLNLIADGVMGKQWELVSTNDQPNDDQKLIIGNILGQPNPQDDFESFFRAILEDSLVGDCMCFEKAKAGNPQHPMYLWTVDGMSVDLVINTDEHRYAQLNGGNRTYYTADELAYIKRVSRTNTPFGLSPLETAFSYIAALTNAFEYSADVSSDALPKYVLNIGKEAGQKIEEFRNYFVNDCMGTVSIPIVATDKIESAQIAPVSEEATFMGYQSFLMGIIAYSFGVPADFIGISKSNDRSTLLEKLQLMNENGVKPYLKLIEKAVNKHIIGELGYNLRFQFIREETLEEKQKKVTLITTQVSSELITIDEAREKLGYKPLDTEFSSETISIYKAKVNEHWQINGFGDAKATADKTVDKPKDVS